MNPIAFWCLALGPNLVVAGVTYGLIKLIHRDQVRRQHRLAHSLTVEAQDDGGYQIVG